MTDLQVHQAAKTWKLCFGKHMLHQALWPFDKYTRENTDDHKKAAIMVIIAEWVRVILYCKLIPAMVAMKLPVQCCISTPSLLAHTILALFS